MSRLPPELQKQWMDRWQKRQAKKDYRRFPRLVSESIKLVRQTSGKRFFVIVALRTASGLLSGAMLLLGRNTLAAFVGAGQGGAFFRPLSLLGLVYGISTVFGWISGQLESLLTAQVQRKTMDDVLDVATSVRLEAYESPQFFDHLKRVESNALTEPATVVSTLIQLPANLAGVLAVMGALVLLQPLLLPIVFISMIPLAIMTRINARRSFEFAKARAPGDRERDYLRSLLTGKDEAKEVRAFGAGVELRARYERLYDQYLQQLRRFRRKQLAVSAAGSAAAFVVVASWALLIGSLFISGRTSGANLGAGAIAIPMLMIRAFGFVRMIGDLYTSALFIEDYREFLTLKPSPAPARQEAATEGKFHELTLQNVHFRYPGSSVEALQGVDMTIRAGEVVALVGENGSGKTTLAKLLAHLFRPASGQILWDGVNVDNLDASDVQQQISVIFQDFVRYQLSAADNIALGRPEAASDRQAVISAASQAGADEFLSCLEKGYDTILSKAFGGIDLSIGQWQRVALARAFFRNASFIILDEPTAALDARAEHALFEKIRELRQGRTVLLISHRFSTVRSADRIYVLKQGAIAERGTHTELMALGGLYAELYNLQASTSLNAAAGSKVGG
jgi:ATP-binding cassette subfamily B protein